MSRKDGIKQLIKNHNRRLQKLKEQQALSGYATPPEILTEIEDIKEILDELNAKLEQEIDSYDLSGKTLGGKYVITRLLGQGAIADVYQANQTDVFRPVALKIIRDDRRNKEALIERFHNEAIIAANLNHANIVRVFGFAREENLYYMIMELVEGSTLKDKLEDHKARQSHVPLAETVKIFKQLTSAVDYAHVQGVVHRDLKPSNIMFAPDGRVTLTDFGIARIAGVYGGTIIGGVLGTPAYMSPEQAQGEPVDKRSDIYALGAILFEMAAGCPPFEGDSHAAVIMQHITQPVPNPQTINPNIPEPVAQIIRKALNKDPAGRYETAGKMAQALLNAIETEAQDKPQPEDKPESPDEPVFSYDAYISYVDQKPDSIWVREELLPRLEKEDLRVAVSGISGRRGVPGVVNIEQGVEYAKRIVLVLSPAYLTDARADFENILGQTEGLRTRTYRLLPVKIAPIDENELRGGLRMLDSLDLTDPHQAKSWFEELVQELQHPLFPRGYVARA